MGDCSHSRNRRCVLDVGRARWDECVLRSRSTANSTEACDSLCRQGVYPFLRHRRSLCTLLQQEYVFSFHSPAFSCTFCSKFASTNWRGRKAAEDASIAGTEFENVALFSELFNLFCFSQCKDTTLVAARLEKS